jgi:single-stranded-DNA-specific exonuclease
VLGIVASKVMDRYYRPVVLIALRTDRAADRPAASPASTSACLAACDMHLEELGGHAGREPQNHRSQAAAFRHAFEKAIRQVSGPDLFIPTLTVDAELDLGEISEELVDQLKPEAVWSG